jgi:hypothetical protein
MSLMASITLNCRFEFGRTLGELVHIEIALAGRQFDRVVDGYPLTAQISPAQYTSTSVDSKDGKTYEGCALLWIEILVPIGDIDPSGITGDPPQKQFEAA